MNTEKTAILSEFKQTGGEGIKKDSSKIFFILNFVLLFAVLGVVGINQILLEKVNKSLGIKNVFGKLSSIGAGGATSGGIQLTGDSVNDAIKLVVSGGMPTVYGQELGVSFDQVEQSMNVMKRYDPTYGDQKIILSGDNLNRYIDIGLRISCEYCCGAAAIIGKNGEAACGCAHSQAMRGLAAYLIQSHGAEYSNDEILRELARWKGMFFPKQMIQKMTEQRQNGQYSPDIAALLLGLDLPAVSGAASSGNAPLPSSIENLPSMVGGC